MYATKDSVFCGRVMKALRTDAGKGHTLAALAACANIPTSTLVHPSPPQPRRRGNSEHSVPHLACANTKGPKHLLFLTRRDFVNVSVFVERRVRPEQKQPVVVEAHLLFDDVLFDGTVLDGEMHRLACGKWVFLVTDVLALAGRSCASDPLPVRLSLAHTVLKRMYQHGGLAPCVFQVMKHFQVHDVASASAFFAALPYGCTGVRLRPAVGDNTPDTVLLLQHGKGGGGGGATRTREPFIELNKKSTPRPSSSRRRRPFHTNLVPVVRVGGSSGETIPTTTEASSAAVKRLLFVQPGNEPDVYHLYDDLSSASSMGIAGVRTLENSRFLRQVLSSNTHRRVLMQCSYDPKIAKWVPEKRANAGQGGD